ncbi:AAA family ATPase [Maribacter polysiphoniae]|uniref:AAA domain-containing protein n=1 Tax=Maribacter polysiphoniae TaxID=429344 RepID=A0A316E378_9FLAO|nr:AAA family ATPase [Maribacter polysiphoniae]MBD1263231.1 AAA family ATPase [Maribacter polysiphoniae]PWK17350.1 AAA domain-containing protein [Maribacter polysiphoniae]
MSKNITTKIEATNLGPHINLSNSFPMSKLKIGVFANNGTGKTFLSRAFRLINNNDIEHVNKILTINQSKGHFKLKISEQKEGTTIHKNLSIDVEKNKVAKISNDTDYIFHVFNSDYIRENIEELKFQPDGEIDGYILGKTKIDLTNEKKKVEIISKDIIAKSTILTGAVNTGKKELDKQHINKGTSEYKFTVRNVYDGDLSHKEEKSYEELVQSNKTLAKTPDDLPDISEIEYGLDGNFLTDIGVLLETSYSKSEIAQTFKDKVLTKQIFIETGLALLPEKPEADTECPFCEQILLNDALDLIEKYNDYLEDSEAKVYTEIKNAIKALDKFEKDILNYKSAYLQLKNEFDSNKKFIPSLADEQLLEPEQIELAEDIKTLNQLLNKKLKNIEQEINEKQFKKPFKNIIKQISFLEANGIANNKKIGSFNTKKNNLKDEKLILNRRLCRAMYLKIRKEQKSLIEDIGKLNINKKTLQAEIAKKESKEKVSKKDKVLQNLKSYLKVFFGNKYSVDDDFCFKFNKHALVDNATDVLSDGEKSIVAFCYYIADVYKIVERDDDYNKLFFIIDDPISSLDFHYVYAISQTIRNLHKNLDVERVRFIVLTHNLEFMSILIRNKIIDMPLILANQKLMKLSRQLVMPYEEHLRDIYGVSNGGIPTHTTPNSVRHVLETINKFEAPDKLLQDYCDGNKILGDNEFIYSLMHDASHGGLRNQKAYTDEMIREGCAVVIEFVKTKFKGQINQITA